MDSDVIIGLGGCAMASLAFGSMYVPMKHQKSKNPFFLQWLISVGIILIGYVIQMIEGFPPFYPFAMIGGFFWTIASLCSLPVIERIGMAVGMLLWNTSNCLIGWASGRFGLLGIKQTIPEMPWLNVVGLCVMLTGGAAFSLVRIEKKSANRLPTTIGAPVPDSPLLKPVREERRSATVTVHVRSACRSRASGIALALFCGIFYASTNLPVFYIQDNISQFKDAVPRGLPYMFSLYSGVFLGSSISFLAHCIVRKSTCTIDGKLVLPAIAGGMLWGFAMAARFVANDCLSQTVTFPITTTVPGCTAAAWSLFYFKEIKGSRNYKVLSIAFLFVLIGAIMVTVSKLKL
ncbi:hypothetical protein QR680_002815 [Steinernema hermaphroditum]|uniref:Transmembrane protein 144 n=1 Tax=Steinernema hermaphroditum TaxID=289476 RepID=A0AA39LIX5_9BILA|nr:hypothetical protein QR680_002815 [Steinernema hermaphroditum]